MRREIYTKDRVILEPRTVREENTERHGLPREVAICNERHEAKEGRGRESSRPTKKSIRSSIESEPTTPFLIRNFSKICYKPKSSHMKQS